MVSMNYRYENYKALRSSVQLSINSTIEKCNNLYINDSTTLRSNSTNNASTHLSLPELLLYTCDFCYIDETEGVWETGICDIPAKVGFNICVYILYTIILIIAVIGNVLVVYVVWSCTKMQTVTNYFIANLAVGDLFMAIFCVPFSFMSTLILQYWPFGFHLCVTVNYLQAVSVFVSSYTLVAISIDRYLAIIYPLRPRMTRFQAKIIILIVWLLSLITTLPIAIFSEVMEPNLNFYRLNDLKVCQENWGQYRQDAGAAYSATLMLLQYFLPLLVLVFTYTRIAVAIWGKKNLGEHPIKLDRLARSKRKTIEMMITCVSAYTLAWLPLNVYNILRDIPGMLETISDESHFKLFFGIHWLAMAHTCCNPIIYFWMNPKFRVGYVKALSCCRSKCCEDSCPTLCHPSPPSPYFSSVQDRNDSLHPSCAPEARAPAREKHLSLSCCHSCYCYCCTMKSSPPSPPSFDCELAAAAAATRARTYAFPSSQDALHVV